MPTCTCIGNHHFDYNLTKLLGVPSRKMQSLYCRFYLNSNCSRWWYMTAHDSVMIICHKNVQYTVCRKVNFFKDRLFPKSYSISFYWYWQAVLSSACCPGTQFPERSWHLKILIDRWLHWWTFCVYAVPWTRNHVSCVHPFAMDPQ